MQNNAKYFTFHFSHSRKSSIQIRRVRVSKRLLQNGLLSFALILGISSLGIGLSGVSNYSGGSNSGPSPDPVITQLSTTVSAGPASIDYSRPVASSHIALNAGGPSLSELGTDDAELENQLRVIETTSNPTSLPNMWAHMGKINNEFGFRRNPFGGRTYEFHAGMDIDGERGDNVLAPANGVVTKAGWQGGYGNMIEIDHGNGLTTRYGHLSRIEVAVGDEIGRGMLIGYVGSTGRSTGPHLHYELRIQDRPINPRRFLPPEMRELSKG
jgi:murein DD-endopeptidase MepM/ murein hydrolase activator NlpD